MDPVTNVSQLRAILGDESTADAGGVDRGGFYLAYFDHTMRDAATADQEGDATRAETDRATARQVSLQAEITTYSGFAGEAALIGNALAKNASPALYPATLNSLS